MNRIETMMFDLLRNESTGLRLSDDDLRQLYQLSKKHELAHLMADALAPSDSPYIAQFQTQLFDAHYRCERYRYAFEQLQRQFESAQIPYIPLKGLVLRSFYPEPWMRISCDMDILVHKEDLEQAKRILTELGYCPKTETAHDVSFSSGDGVCVELHHRLMEQHRAASAQAVLAHVWEYAHPIAPGQFQHVMEDEIFYFYHIAHMAKHFERGGCGIRSVLDLWLMEQHHAFWTERTTRLLEKGGLLTFAKVVRGLAGVWFHQESPDSLLLQMEEYILRGGIYGSAENQYAVSQYRSGGKFRYFLSRLFLPLEGLKYQYPVLQKHPWLFPVCQVARWMSLLTGRKTKARKNALRNIQNTTDEQVVFVSDLLTRLGL